MTRVTGSLRAVGVHPADPAVWPGRRVNDRFTFFFTSLDLPLLVPQELDDRPMALPTPIDGIGIVPGHARHFFRKDVVEARENLTGFCVMAPCKLYVFLFMTRRARFRRDQRRDQGAMMRPPGKVGIPRAVAVYAPHAILGVA
jgi:hypothetical protein